MKDRTVAPTLGPSRAKDCDPRLACDCGHPRSDHGPCSEHTECCHNCACEFFQPIETAVEGFERGWAEADRLLRIAVNELCDCGGRAPQDPGVCTACLIWHRTRAAAGPVSPFASEGLE